MLLCRAPSGRVGNPGRPLCPGLHLQLSRGLGHNPAHLLRIPHPHPVLGRTTMFFRCLGPSSPHGRPRPALPRPLGPGGRSLLRAAAATGTSPRARSLPAPARAGPASPGDARGEEAAAPPATGRAIRPRPAGPEPPARAAPAATGPGGSDPTACNLRSPCDTPAAAGAGGLGQGYGPRRGPAPRRRNIMAGGCGAGRWGWGCSAAQMGRRSRVIPCGTAPWRVPGAGRLRGRRAPRGRGRVAASRSPGRSGVPPGAGPSGAGGQGRSPRGRGSPGRRSPKPSGRSRGQSASGLEGQRGKTPGRRSASRPTKDGRSHTLPPPPALRPLCPGPAGVTLRARGAAGNRVPEQCCPASHTPAPGAASHQPPLLAAEHPGGIAIARKGRTRAFLLSLTAVQHHFQNVNLGMRIALLDHINGFKRITPASHLYSEHIAQYIFWLK
ncbi:collagen alpha-1(I) chain-like [Pseudopipra pipra]|uniref:collagen alpha-1(I) chain-like n=1 Tax=Pseudopipra pipra TaxID=415032 RepID=UPI00313864F0